MDPIEFLLLPEKHLPEYIKDVKDIYDNRTLLKRMAVSEYSLNYLLDILIPAVEGNVRFRRLDCLKVIKTILRNNPFGLELSDHTTNRLFYLYRIFISHKNDEVRRCVNDFVRSRCLDDASIEWLVSHWDQSEHSTNRLLRYPQSHPRITEWAKNIYQQGQLRDRRSEVIALLIDDSVPSYVSESRNTIIWAIYRARVTDETKQKLLIQYVSHENLGAMWQVATRLGYSDVVDFMRKKIAEEQERR
jgi:hypothetical protein